MTSMPHPRMNVFDRLPAADEVRTILRGRWLQTVARFMTSSKTVGVTTSAVIATMMGCGPSGTPVASRSIESSAAVDRSYDQGGMIVTEDELSMVVDMPIGPSDPGGLSEAALQPPEISISSSSNPKRGDSAGRRTRTTMRLVTDEPSKPGAQSASIQSASIRTASERKPHQEAADVKGLPPAASLTPTASLPLESSIAAESTPKREVDGSGEALMPPDSVSLPNDALASPSFSLPIEPAGEMDLPPIDSGDVSASPPSHEIAMVAGEAGTDVAADAPIADRTESDDQATVKSILAGGDDSNDLNIVNSSVPTDTPPTAQPADTKPGVEQPSDDYRSWPTPRVALVVTGNQHGYIEPCGCTGLDKQKGGVARRYTFIEQLRGQGWTLLPIDAGNQVRRYGLQAEMKLEQSVRALREMDYAAVGIGPDDVRLGIGPMLTVASDPANHFNSANTVLFDEDMVPKFEIVGRGGVNVAVTSILDVDSMKSHPSGEIEINPIEVAATAVLEKIAQRGDVDYRVLMFYGDEDAAKTLVKNVGGFDLVVVSGGYGEPTFQPMEIPDSTTRLIVTGDKGMYAGVVGLYDGDRDSDSTLQIRYARVPLTHEFADAPRMRALMADYQEKLRQVGFEGLGLLPAGRHPSGDEYVGTATCGKCHTNALAVWEGSAHAGATEHLVRPPRERSDIARHFDPECVSCHVTGWNPQEYYPYQTGYVSLEASGHLLGNGCENCHGPGAAHSAAEEPGADVSDDQRLALRVSMRLPLSRAKQKCMECHDLDNSPDFHEPDAFEDVYWPEVEHYGLD